MLKIRKDVALALTTVAGALAALFALFVAIPVWLEAVVITLTAVGVAATISDIIRAYKASYNEETGKHTYKFPVWTFVLGTLILVVVDSIIILSLKRLFGFALIPVAALLAIILVIAFLKELRIMKWITGLLLAVLVVALVGYYTSALVHSGVNLNPGISVETEVNEETSSSDDAESEVQEDDNNSSEVIEDTAESEAPETTVPETEVPESTESESEETNPTEPKLENDTDDVVVQNPVEEVEKPEVETEPTEPETQPEEDYAPAVVKINAPKTMSFAEPIIITVEGIDLDDLRFGNDGFLSIIFLSDTEVEVTLIGMVNDAGEPVLVPASGYITITDSVSGVHVTIEIVE